jgi:hypothetical protein
MTGSLQERYGEEGRSYTVVTGVKWHRRPRCKSL